jgi:hypothetical protein
MTVRVIRILEYVYPDHETAELDMRNWNVPENGSVHKGGGMGTKKYIITSATMSPRTVSTDETVPLLDDPNAPMPDWARPDDR